MDRGRGQRRSQGLLRGAARLHGPAWPLGSGSRTSSWRWSGGMMWDSFWCRLRVRRGRLATGEVLAEVQGWALDAVEAEGGELLHEAVGHSHPVVHDSEGYRPWRFTRPRPLPASAKRKLSRLDRMIFEPTAASRIAPLGRRDGVPRGPRGVVERWEGRTCAAGRPLPDRRSSDLLGGLRSPLGAWRV
jgi:hypothetical protein